MRGFQRRHGIAPDRIVGNGTIGRDADRLTALEKAPLRIAGANRSPAPRTAVTATP